MKAQPLRPSPQAGLFGMLAFWLRIKVFWSARTYVARLGRLFLDRRVPPSLKILTALSALVIVSPIDVFSDIPVLGAFDDLALLGLLAMLFVRFCPPEVVADYFGAANGRSIKNVTRT